jgi:OmpA-OmpF porin, OOP family
MNHSSPKRSAFCVFLFAPLAALCGAAFAADLAGATDPPDMRRYEGSEIIGHRAPRFDEYLLPLGPPTSFGPPVYEDALAVEGLVTRVTYVAPEGRSAAEIFRNYRLEFERLGLETLYAKGTGERGMFGPTFDQSAQEDGLGQILAYNEAQERMLVGRSRDPDPTYYQVFVTTYRDGVIPRHLAEVVTKDRGLVHVVVIAPERMEERMAFVSAAEMSVALADSGRVVLEGLYFDTDKDTIRADSRPMIEEIARLLGNEPALKVRVVGHSDNVGSAEYNLNLSRRRAASVANELTTAHGIAADRLDAFGAGPYAPVASNRTDAGRALNRRVELVAW